MTNERTYSEKTKKLLWARSRNLCAFPECRQKITDRVGGTGGDVILGEVAHIVALSKDGPRADPGMPRVEKNSYENLIVLCPTHHKLVDSLATEYNAERLRAWKRNHEGISEAWTDEMFSAVERAIILGGWTFVSEESTATIIEISGVQASLLRSEDQIKLVRTAILGIEADPHKNSLRYYCHKLHSPGSFPYRSLFRNSYRSLFQADNLPQLYVEPYLEETRWLGLKESPARIRFLDALETQSDSSVTNHLLLLGEAGCGKSTLLRMTQLEAASKLRAEPAKACRVPILVRLQTLALKEGTFETRMWRALESAQDLTFDREPPEGYFSTWSKVGQFDWLLLLDGLDEIDVREFGGLQSWLEEALCRVQTVVVTSRPSNALVDWFSGLENARYHLRFDSERCLLLAHNLLGEAAAHFVLQLNGLVRQSIAETPLMITLAAALYQRHGALLPKTSLDLYEQVIEQFLQELEERGGREEMPDELLAFSKPVLEELAYRMTVGPSTGKVEDLVPVVAERLARVLEKPLALMSRPSYAERLVRFLGKRSGTFTCIGNAAGWSHGTFREYLCAKFVQERPASDPLVAALIDPLRQSRELIQMLLWVSKFSSDIAMKLLSMPDSYAANAILVVNSICDGAEISVTAQDLAISRVEQRLVENSLGSYCASLLTQGLPASMCAELLAKAYRARPYAWTENRRERLIATLLAKAKGYIRLDWDFPSVFESLAQLGAQSELWSLVEDDSCPPYARLIAAKKGEHPDTRLVGNLINQLADLPGTILHRVLTFLASGPQLIAAAMAPNVSPELALAISRQVLQQGKEPGEQFVDSAQGEVIRAWAEDPAASSGLRVGALSALVELEPLDPDHGNGYSNSPA